MRGARTQGAAAVAARLGAIPEPRMRVALMAELLAEGPAAGLVDLIGDLVARAGEATIWAALDSIVLLLSEGSALTHERRAELYAVATAAGRPEIALLLLDAAPLVPGTEKLERELGGERPLVPSGRSLPLGERKALARMHRRELLLQLIRDPHPDVIAVLIANPHLTESDILKLASRRPMLPRALAAIAASDRWRVRAPVRRALVLNPFTALPLAARLMTTLAEGDLERVQSDPALADRLRQHAADLLARRRAARAG